MTSYDNNVVRSLQLTTFHLSTVFLRSSVAMTTTSVCPRIGCVMGGRTALIGQMKTPPYVVSDLMTIIVTRSKSLLDYMYMTECTF